MFTSGGRREDLTVSRRRRPTPRSTFSTARPACSYLSPQRRWTASTSSDGGIGLRSVTSAPTSLALTSTSNGSSEPPPVMAMMRGT